MQARRIEGVACDGIVGEEPAGLRVVVACAEVEKTGFRIVEVAGVGEGGVAGEGVGLAGAVASGMGTRSESSKGVVSEVRGAGRRLAA
jgi:hypothetical protein